MLEHHRLTGCASASEDIPARGTSSTRARRLTEQGVFVSTGDFYASTVVEALGQARDGLVRAGCACYTTEDEVERLLDGVRRMG